jgi:SRSO17 transposase
MKQQDTSSFPSAEELWTAEFQDVCERMSSVFARSETRKRARTYVQGLLSPIKRKNGWQLAEEAGEGTPYAMQYLLDRAVWDAEHLRDMLREYVKEAIGDPNGMLVIDETGFLKKGTKSVGVQRQYSGTAGRIENCQIGVFLTYTSQAGHTLTGPSIVSAQELDQRSATLSRSRCACLGRLCHQTETGGSDALAHA